MAKLLKNSGNQTTVGTTTIGGAIAIVLVVVANQFGANLSSEATAMLVGAFTAIFNYVIPSKKK